MQRARFWILCAMAALVIISGALFLSARHWRGAAKALKNVLPADVDMRLDDLVLNEAGAGDRTMVVNADRAHYYKTRDLFVLEGVRAHVLTADGDYLIRAQNGTYEQGDKKIALSGHISLVDREGGVLTTESLRYDFNESLLTGDGPFCYSTPGLDLDGQAFVFHTKDGRLAIDGRARLLFN